MESDTRPQASDTSPGRDAATRRRNAPVDIDEPAILLRGLDTFAELGYDATTVRELARRLGVSHNFINDRYGSKAAFWRAVVDAALTGVQRERDELVAEHHDDEERMRRVIVQLYRMAAASAPVSRLFADESTRDSDRLDYLYQAFIGPFWASIEPTVARLMESGRIPRVPTHVLYFTITGPAMALAQEPVADRLSRRTDAPTTLDRETAAETLAALVLRGLLPARPAALRA